MKVGFLSRVSVWLTELSDESCQGGTFALPDKTAKMLQLCLAPFRGASWGLVALLLMFLGTKEV